MRICNNCENGIFCDTWTEVKCTIRKRRITDPKREALRCKNFKKDNREEKPKCQCKQCMSRGKED